MRLLGYAQMQRMLLNWIPNAAVSKPDSFRFTAWGGLGPGAAQSVKYAGPTALILNRTALGFFFYNLKYAILSLWRCHGAGRLAIKTTHPLLQHWHCWYYVGFASEM